MECPKCASTTLTGSGCQIAAITEYYEAGEEFDYDLDDWHQRLGRWAWACQDCGERWSHVANTQIQWIGEDAAQAEAAYGRGDYDTLKACLDAIRAHAGDLGYVPAAPEEHPCPDTN
jgi:hypothetical protein